MEAANICASRQRQARGVRAVKVFRNTLLPEVAEYHHQLPRPNSQTVVWPSFEVRNLASARLTR